jgi:hypothetical protein
MLNSLEMLMFCAVARGRFDGWQRSREPAGSPAPPRFFTLQVPANLTFPLP